MPPSSFSSSSSPSPESTLAPSPSPPSPSPSPSPSPELPFALLEKSLRSSALLSSIDSSISSSDLRSLLSHAYPVTFPPGTPLITQGHIPPPSSPSSLLILSSGTVNVSVTKHGQPPVTVSTVNPGDVIGDQLLLTPLPPSASVTTASTTTAYAIPTSVVTAFIAAHPSVADNVRQRRWLWGAVSRVPQFKDLDDDIRKEALIAHFTREEVQEGEVVVRYGDTGDRFYVIEKGECEVRVPQAQATSAAPSPSSAPPAPPSPPPPAPSPASLATTPVTPSTTLASLFDRPQTPTTEVVVDRKGPSDSFGELALLYSVPRAATVTCSSPSGCALWSIDADTFRSTCTEASLWLKQLFYQHASVKDSKTGDRLMTDRDFFQAVRKTTLHRDKKKRKKGAGGAAGEAGGEEEAAVDDSAHSELSRRRSRLSEQQLRLMFRLADQSGDNLISFSEFVLLNSLLTSPLSKYAVAFRLFDRDRSGTIDRDEFVQVVKALATDKHGTRHDYTHDPFINDLFGPPATSSAAGGGGWSSAAAGGGKKRVLTYAQFEDLLNRDVLPTWLHSVKHELRSVDDYWMRWNQVMTADQSGVSMLAADSTFAFPSWKSLVAGGVAGAVSRTVVSPLERIKLLFQMQGQPPTYTSTWQAMRRIYRDDGLKGFFYGNLANVIRITPTSAFQFFFYDLYKRAFYHNRKDLTPLERLWAGGLAGCTALVLTYPLDLVRARLTFQTSQDRQYKGIVHGLTTVVTKEGPLALYKGLWPSVAGIFPCNQHTTTPTPTLPHSPPQPPSPSPSPCSIPPRYWHRLRCVTHTTHTHTHHTHSTCFYTRSPLHPLHSLCL